MSKVNSQPILRRTEMFETVKSTSCSAVSERKVGNRWAVGSSVPETVQNREKWEENERM